MEKRLWDKVTRPWKEFVDRHKLWRVKYWPNMTKRWLKKIQCRIGLKLISPLTESEGGIVDANGRALLSIDRTRLLDIMHETSMQKILGEKNDRIVLEVENPHNQTVVVKNGLRTIHVSLDHDQIIVSAWAEVPGEDDQATFGGRGMNYPVPSKPSDIKKSYLATQVDSEKWKEISNCKDLAVYLTDPDEKVRKVAEYFCGKTDEVTLDYGKTSE